MMAGMDVWACVCVLAEAARCDETGGAVKRGHKGG